MSGSHSVCLLLALLFSMTCHAAEAYKWVDEDGNTHYSDQPARHDARPLNLETQPADRDDELRQRREKRDKLLEVFAEERKRRQQEKHAAPPSRPNTSNIAAICANGFSNTVSRVIYTRKTRPVNSVY